MPTHKITLVYDEADRAVRVTHRTEVDVAGLAVGFAEHYELPEAAAALAGLIDQNRAEMEARATLAAIEHAAALAGRVRKGRKAVKVGGTLGALGATEAKKV